MNTGHVVFNSLQVCKKITVYANADEEKQHVFSAPEYNGVEPSLPKAKVHSSTLVTHCSLSAHCCFLNWLTSTLIMTIAIERPSACASTATRKRGLVYVLGVTGAGVAAPYALGKTIWSAGGVEAGSPGRPTGSRPCRCDGRVTGQLNWQFGPQMLIQLAL